MVSAQRREAGVGDEGTNHRGYEDRRADQSQVWLRKSKPGHKQEEIGEQDPDQITDGCDFSIPSQAGQIGRQAQIHGNWNQVGHSLDQSELGQAQVHAKEEPVDEKERAGRRQGNGQKEVKKIEPSDVGVHSESLGGVCAVGRLWVTGGIPTCTRSPALTRKADPGPNSRRLRWHSFQKSRSLWFNSGKAVSTQVVINHQGPKIDPTPADIATHLITVDKRFVIVSAIRMG